MAHEPAPAEPYSDVQRSMLTFGFGVAECLVDPHRRVVDHGLGKTDAPQHMTKRLCHDACDRAFAMKVGYVQKRAGNLPQPRERVAQVGFLRGKELPGSPGSKPHYEVTPITAKHNLRKIENTDHAFYPADATIASVYLKSDLSERQLNFNDLNVSVLNQKMVLRQCILRDAEWNFGIDVSVGDTVTSREEGITNERASFELASGDYDYKRGQKVGIAVFNTVQPTAKSASPDPSAPLNLKPEELLEIYGKHMETKVYAGEITWVGEHHIEYDINSFEGCSGAIVFLLDEKQDASVPTHDYGRAIAIHAGTHPLLSDRNFGFKLKDLLD